ncbi:MAG TPA: aspartate--tRNA ligase [Patescibacteria group bacterium]|nr:aspartate--tRNA ligase [Patescibacteria group bacterium]
MIERQLATETIDKVGERVTIMGWVHARRNMGKVAFLDMRDRTGILQVVVVPGELDDDASRDIVADIRPEYVLKIEGEVQARGEKQINDKMATGTVEILAKKIEILNTAETPPFELDRDTSAVTEEARLAYRYLDLRTDRMTRNMRMRGKVFQFIREYLTGSDFTEIETPILTKGTPEGAREYIVPSRLYSGKFYVLPQAPQQFKQLLMTAGIEKYFQMAKCFRDEDQRGDRQPEFTQMDLEMSFVDREDVMTLIESMLIEVVNKLYPEKKIQQVPFPRISYKEAMDKYGNDRPDFRKNPEDPNELAFGWVIDFPFFEKDDEGGWTFTHNPFSSAMPEFADDLSKKENIENIIASQYDVILNGFEIGGGSIRNHMPEALKAVLEILGNDAEQMDEQFGHILKAFEFGAPPHGGIALGMDRIMAILQNEPNIREVMAFPKDGHAKDLMMRAPSPLSKKALREANIEVLSEEE